MRQERDKISNEIQGLNFVELQKYFEKRRVQLAETKSLRLNNAIVI